MSGITCLLSIDPGVRGAVAELLYDGSSVSLLNVHGMPQTSSLYEATKTHNNVDVDRLSVIIRDWTADCFRNHFEVGFERRVVIERQYAGSPNAMRYTFRQAFDYGQIVAAVCRAVCSQHSNILMPG